MELKNTGNAYGLAARALHWGMGLLIIAALCLGAYMSDLPDAPNKFALFDVHKAIGMLVLILVGARIGWRLYDPAPAAIATQKPWEHKLAGAIHLAFYGLMVVVPVSGWAMSSAFGHPPVFFGLFTFPSLIAENKELAEGIAEVHETLAALFWVGLGLHVAGALKHHIIDKDGTLRRMIG